MIRLSMIVNPFTDQNLQLAAQVGVTDIVLTYPGLDLPALLATKRRVESHGLRLTHIERKLPHLKFVHGLPGRDRQIEDFKTLLRNMAEAGMEVLCYNWMPDEDWQRTTATAPERGGAKVTAFDLRRISQNVTDASGRPPVPTPAAQLWDNLAYFLERVLPVAEDAKIKLAIHPDDPPLTHYNGQDRIMVTIDALERVTQLAPSPMNGICYCSGSLAPAGIDVVAGLRRLGPKVFFGHFRNVRGTADNFTETWHDNGAIDMVAVMKTYLELGFTGTLRPDHAPSMAGETNETPGYEMLGRLYAAGYMRGLLQALGGYERYAARA